MIPRRLFQLLALLIVGACAIGSVAWAVRGGAPFDQMARVSGSGTLACLLALLGGLLGSIVLIVPLRMLSTMRPLAEEVRALRALSVEDLRRERARQEARRQGRPEEQRRHQLILAFVSFCCLPVGGAILLTLHEMEAGTLFAFPVALFVYGIAGPPVHLTLAYRRGKVPPSLS